jgi:hypothetical protein
MDAWIDVLAGHGNLSPKISAKFNKLPHICLLSGHVRAGE